MSSQFIPFHVPQIDDEEIRSVVETLKSGWLTTGVKVKRFEGDFASYLGCGHAIAVNSCTAALHLALEAVGIEEGDEVIVPTMTFTATAEVVLYFKARPVLVDCRRDTFNIDPDRVEQAITAKTKAIIPVHFGGQPCDMEPIRQIARAGGMATTDNTEWAERMRMMSLHGISHDAWKRYTKEGSWYYEVLRPGFKYNLTDIGAAIGIEQLKKCDAFGAARKRIATAYNEGLSKLPEIQTPVCESDVQHAWHLYVIQLDLERLKINRYQFIEALKEQGIGTSVHFIPLHLHPYYRDKFGYAPDDFPKASETYQRIISLPIYPKMTEAHIEHVIAAVGKIVQEQRR